MKCILPLTMFSKKTLHIAIGAGKGGVGKSSVTAFLARSLSKMGKRVGVLDADIYGPSLRHMLPEEEGPELIKNRLKPARCGNISLMSPSFFEGGEQGFFVRAPVLHKWIKYFCEETDFSEEDVILYDLPPGTGDVAMTLCQTVPFSGVILVTTPQELVQLDVRKAYHLFFDRGIKVFGILENMSYLMIGKKKFYPFGQGGGEKLSYQLGIPFLGKIPLEKEISIASDEGRGLKEGKVSSLFDHLAKTLLERNLC
jgi:ATP-binding protein involved in chromosome partitioning